MDKKIISIKVKTESVDWRIDDFLGNSFQYKIDNEWHYDTSVNLPNCELEIIGLSEKSTKENKIVNILLKS